MNRQFVSTSLIFAACLVAAGSPAWAQTPRRDEARGGRPILDRHAEWLKANSSVQVAIDGGADQRGSVEHNQKLSERRAQAVRDYLVMRGVPADRIHQLGYGEGLLACRDTGEACWQQNRRANFLVKMIERQKP